MPAPRPVPPSERPWPSPSWAKADWVMFTSRSETLVVAVEQLCGNTGAATTLFSAYVNARRRNDPALRGMSLSRLLKIAPTTALVAAAREVLRPQSTHGGLSRRSTSIIAFFGSISTMTLSVEPVGQDAFERIGPAGVDDAAPSAACGSIRSCAARNSRTSRAMKALIVSAPYLAQSSLSRRSATRARAERRRGSRRTTARARGCAPGTCA